MTTLPSLRSSSPTTTRSAPLRSILSALALVVLAASAPAQMPGGGRSGINAAMLKLFGEFSSFSSKAEVRMLDKGAKEPISMMVDFSMLDGQVRMDLDISTLKSTEVSAEILQSFKAAGLDKVTTIIRPHQKSALLIYPVVRGYVDLPMSKEEAADMDRKFTGAGRRPASI